MKIKEIIIYPVKGLSGVSLFQCKVSQNGLENDRIYMLSDPNGALISQRTTSQLSLMKVSRKDNAWQISYKDHRLDIVDNSMSENKMEVDVWGSRFYCNEVDPLCSDWFSEQLDMECKLMVMPSSDTRVKKFDIAPFETTVSFADGYPILLIGEASVSLLNNKLAQPIRANRFRANLIIESDEPHVEDTWKDIRIGDQVILRNIKPCVRCQVITIDQDTGRQGKEPMKTLSTYRKSDNKICFGSNAIVVEHGKISIGDNIVPL